MCPLGGCFVGNYPLNLVDPTGHNGETPTPPPPGAPTPPPETPPPDPDGTPVAVTSYEAWRANVLLYLWQAGPRGQWAADYIIEHNIQFSFDHPPSYASDTGAQWTVGGHINLSAHSYSLDSPTSDDFMLSLIAHEAFHLAQGPAKALSVVGEVEAYKYQNEVWKELTGGFQGDYVHPSWKGLVDFTLNESSRENIRQAEELLIEAGGSHYEKYPLRPIPVLGFLSFLRRSDYY